MKKIFDIIKKIETEIPVSEIMRRNIIKLSQNDTVQKAIVMMGKHSISGIIVVDKDKNPIGIISEGDIIKKVLVKGKVANKTKIKDVMTKNLLTISPLKSIGQVSLLMKNKKISKLPVVHKGNIIGIVTKADLLQKINDIYRQNRSLIWLAAIAIIELIVIILLIKVIVGPG